MGPAISSPIVNDVAKRLRNRTTIRWNWASTSSPCNASISFRISPRDTASERPTPGNTSLDTAASRGGLESFIAV